MLDGTGRLMAWDGVERRRSPSARTVVIAMVVACVYMTVILVVSEVRRHDETDARAKVVYTNSLNSCRSGNGIRSSINERTKTQQADADRLEALARRLATTRSQEAAVFERLQRQLADVPGVRFDIVRLVKTLRSAAEDDRKIAREQSRIVFNDLAKRPCLDAVEKP